MKTYSYKTLRGLLSQTSHGQINLNELNCGRTYLNGRGWCKFKLNEVEKDKAFRMILGVIYNKKELRDKYRFALERVKSCGLLDRLVINKYGASYCAGQDYPGEVRFIQSLVRKAF